MILKTKLHGDIDYRENDIIIFPKEILGFQNLNKFILFPMEGNEVFSILHSIEDISVGFVVTSPFLIDEKYEINIENNVLEELKIDSPEDVLVLNIVNVNQDIKKTTINLRAPVIINIKEKLGTQIILGTEKYKIKTPIIRKE